VKEKNDVDLLKEFAKEFQKAYLDELALISKQCVLYLSKRRRGLIK